MNEDYDGRAIQARPAAVKADGKYILKSPNPDPFFSKALLFRAEAKKPLVHLISFVTSSVSKKRAKTTISLSSVERKFREFTLPSGD
jgi:hypothetical protein